MNITGKRGTISLETAISFSVVMIFITAIISVTAFIRTDILMQRAVEQSCEDLAHYMPFTVMASDIVSTVFNAMPDNNEDTGMVERIGSLVAGVDTVTSGGLRAGAMNLLLGDMFTDDIASEYYEYNGSTFFGPDTISVDFDIKDYYISVYVVYSVDTIAGPISREIVSSIPFYGDFEMFLSEDEDQTTDNNDIWHQNNFVRGRYFADKYGSNLPSTFPVINYYDSGEARSIVSVDLNRPTYSTPAACMLRITEQIEQLAGFNGADVQISGTRYVVDGNKITSRVLIVVIPEDSPENTRLAVSSLTEYAAIRGVELRIVEDGTSL